MLAVVEYRKEPLRVRAVLFRRERQETKGGGDGLEPHPGVDVRSVIADPNTVFNLNPSFYTVENNTQI
jgi:hypothetical protein